MGGVGLGSGVKSDFRWRLEPSVVDRLAGECGFAEPRSSRQLCPKHLLPTPGATDGPLDRPPASLWAPRGCAGISIIVRGKSALHSERAMPDDLDITIDGGT